MPSNIKLADSIWKFHLEASYFGRNLDFYISDDKGFVEYGTPTITSWRTLVDGQEPPRPSLSLRHQDGQQITDELYRLGFRPSPNLTKEISNRDEHLSDMKKLVEKAYKVKF